MYGYKFPLSSKELRVEKHKAEQANETKSMFLFDLKQHKMMRRYYVIM